MSEKQRNEPPVKLTRAEKREIQAIIRKYKGDGKAHSAQASIPYQAMYPDGICKVTANTFSKCIEFADISYQLAQADTKTAIFENLCDLYNYLDASIHVQFSFVNRKTDPKQYAKSFEIKAQGDDFDDIRAEYSGILQDQLVRGNNGLTKRKFLTFTIEADNLKMARARLTRIETDLLGYGRMFAYDLPMEGAIEPQKADLLTYEENQFGWAKEYLLEGSLDTVASQPGTALIVYEPETTIQVGDTVTLDIGGKNQQLQIAGMLSTAPFGNANDTALLICSEDTFRQLSGTSNYTIVDIQLTNKATDEDVNAIQQIAGTSYTFSDERMSNSSVRGTYYCFCLFIYGFLVLIALITVFNIINSITMSVAARTRQYGVFRAIGLSTRQLKKMIIAEACVYTITGSIIGTVLGLICNQKLFEMLITSFWGDAWGIPWMELTIILFIMILKRGTTHPIPASPAQRWGAVEVPQWNSNCW